MRYLIMGRGSNHHFCLLVFAQDSWREKDYDKISKKTFGEFISKNSHADCKQCMVCPVCRATWNLFDPTHPEEFMPHCDLCDIYYNVFKNKQGGTDGLILFSHSNVPEESVRDFVSHLLSQIQVKKVYVLQETSLKLGKLKIQEVAGKIIEKKIKLSEFVAQYHEIENTYGILYEIVRDSYERQQN